MLEIDGSFGSGGGSILRFCTAFSAITSTPVRVVNIRAGRPRPGLAAQHLEGIKAAAMLCNARVDGAHLGSTEIEFSPGRIFTKPLVINIGTAGSTGLIFQTLSLFSTAIRDTLRVTIKGGATFGKFAPPLPYTAGVLIPALREMGVNAGISIIRHGFYPSGGARVEMEIEPCAKLKQASFEEPSPGGVKGISVAGSQLKAARVAERQAEAAAERIPEAKIRVEYADSDCPGSGIVLWSGLMGADGLGERGKKAETVGQEAAGRLSSAIKSGACIDSHLADQLVPFMAMAKGSLTCPEMTDHIRTSIWLTGLFLDCRIEVEQGDMVRIRFR